MNGFNKEDIAKGQELMSLLNSLIGQQMEGHEDINNALSFALAKGWVEVEFKDVIAVLDDGPIYEMVSTVDGLPLTVYVGDFNCVHSIVGISVGHSATYLNENIRNIVKKDVN